jgi:hypothetical protein
VGVRYGVFRGKLWGGVCLSASLLIQSVFFSSCLFSYMRYTTLHITLCGGFLHCTCGLSGCHGVAWSSRGGVRRARRIWVWVYVTLVHVLHYDLGTLYSMG